MLSLRVLGQLDVQIDGESVAIPSRPAELLLAYLVLNPGMRHRREELAGAAYQQLQDKQRSLELAATREEGRMRRLERSRDKSCGPGGRRLSSWLSEGLVCWV